MATTAKDYADSVAFWMRHAREAKAQVAANTGGADQYLVRWCVHHARSAARSLRRRLFTIPCRCGAAVRVNVDPATLGQRLDACPACAGGSL